MKIEKINSEYILCDPESTCIIRSIIEKINEIVDKVNDGKPDAILEVKK